MISRLTAAIAVACLGMASAAATPRQAASDSRTPVLVELFTSEGCSSCPPADQLLMELIATQPVAGARIVALSEHVDYWDRLGWKDPFSAALFSTRQSDYAAAARSNDVYTPQLVVDGQNAFVGSDRGKALAAIGAAAAREKPAIRLAWTAPERAELEITVPEAPALARSRVLLAIAEDGLRTDVRRGENQGRELRHDAVARRLTPVGSTDLRGAFQRVMTVALDRSWQRNALRIVVFVQNSKGVVVAVETIGMR